MAIIMVVPANTQGLICDIYLVTCDVDARDGKGHVTFTADPAKATRFADAGEALTYWKRQSVVRPLRPDGKPNRPLTAYTVELRTVA